MPAGTTHAGREGRQRRDGQRSAARRKGHPVRIPQPGLGTDPGADDTRLEESASQPVPWPWPWQHAWDMHGKARSPCPLVPCAREAAVPESLGLSRETLPQFPHCSQGTGSFPRQQMTCRTNFPELTLLKSSPVPRGSPLAGQIPGEKALLLLRIFIRHGKLVPAPRAGGCRQGLAGLRTFWVLIPDPARMPPVHLSLCPSIHLPVPLSIHPSPHRLLGPPRSCSFHHVPSPHGPRRGSRGPVRGRIPGGAALRCPGRGGPARGSRSAAAPAARGRTRTGRQERPAPAGQRRREGGELPAGPQLPAALPTRCRFPLPHPGRTGRRRERTQLRRGGANLPVR